MLLSMIYLDLSIIESVLHLIWEVLKELPDSEQKGEARKARGGVE